MHVVSHVRAQTEQGAVSTILSTRREQGCLYLVHCLAAVVCKWYCDSHVTERSSCLFSSYTVMSQSDKLMVTMCAQC